MKKVLACGLILSTLMSIGSVCVAGGDDDDFLEDKPLSAFTCANTNDYSVTHYWDDIVQPKKPRKPRWDEEEMSEDINGNRAVRILSDLRNKVMALFSNYYEPGFGALGYVPSEIAQMTIGDLNADCTILTLAGESQELPECVVEALINYLKLRKKLAFNTMSIEMPLFISCKGMKLLKRGLKMTEGGVYLCIRCYCNEHGLPNGYNAQLMVDNLVKLRNKAMYLLNIGNQYKSEKVDDVCYMHREIAQMLIGDLSEDCTVLTFNGTGKDLPKCTVEALKDYLALREKLAPNTMSTEMPLFIDCIGLTRVKQGMPIGSRCAGRGICQHVRENS